jgi:LysR family transcriptional regulator, hydrogen peroxide-inducible genes activator
MNFRDLKYLVSVADCQHFGKASEQCFVSQPTLSTQIKKCEEELGVIIFERTKKKIFLTPIGEQIVAQARIILNQMHGMKTMAEAARDPFGGRFKLGLIPTVAPYLLPHIMEPLKKALPNLEFFLFEEKTTDLMTDLLEGSLDAIILALPVDDANLNREILYEENFVVALPNSDPLSKKKSLTVKDIEDATLLLLDEGHCLRDQALEVCGPAAGAHSGFRATSLETLRHMVASGGGITLLPSLACLAKTHKLTTIKPFTKPEPTRTIAILWRSQSPRQQCCQMISDVIQDTIVPILKKGAAK